MSPESVALVTACVVTVVNTVAAGALGYLKWRDRNRLRELEARACRQARTIRRLLAIVKGQRAKLAECQEQHQADREEIVSLKTELSFVRQQIQQRPA